MTSDKEASVRLAHLAAWLPQLEAGSLDFGHWAGGEKQADGATTMPYFEFSAVGLELLSALPFEVFDWGAWMQTHEARALLADYSLLGSATTDQLVKLCTALRRGDRFSEGTLAWAFESGLLLAIARRAAALTAT